MAAVAEAFNQLPDPRHDRPHRPPHHRHRSTATLGTTYVAGVAAVVAPAATTTDTAAPLAASPVVPGAHHTARDVTAAPADNTPLEMDVGHAALARSLGLAPTVAARVPPAGTLAIARVAALSVRGVNSSRPADRPAAVDALRARLPETEPPAATG